MVGKIWIMNLGRTNRREIRRRCRELRTLKLQDFILRHPIFDQLIPALAFALWHFIGHGRVPGSDDAQTAAYVGLSAVAGIVLAAATFVCTMLYQSSSTSVRMLRREFKNELSKNWASIFVFIFVAATLPIAATLLRDTNSSLAFGFVLYSAAILLGRSFRTFLWLIVSFRLETSPEPAQRASFETRLKPRSK